MPPSPPLPAGGLAGTKPLKNTLVSPTARLFGSGAKCVRAIAVPSSLNAIANGSPGIVSLPRVPHIGALARVVGAVTAKSAAGDGALSAAEHERGVVGGIGVAGGGRRFGTPQRCR